LFKVGTYIHNKACCVIIFSGDSMAHHNDENFQQKIKTSTQIVEIVQRRLKAVGGMELVTLQT
jgi:hypothetical protein